MLSSALFVWSCNKKDNDPDPVITRNLDFSYTETAAIPATATAIFGAAPAGIYLEPYNGAFETNTDAELANEGFTKSDVIAIKGKSLVATIVNTPGQTFDFMDTIKVFVAQKDGTGKVLFARKYGYGLGQTSLDLFMEDVDVKSIFEADSARIYFGGTKRAGNHTIQANTEIDFNTTVTATVNVAQ